MNAHNKMVGVDWQLREKHTRERGGSSVHSSLCVPMCLLALLIQGPAWCLGTTQAGNLASEYWTLRPAVSTGHDCTTHPYPPPPPPPPPHPACAMGQHQSDLLRRVPQFSPADLYYS